MRTLNKNVLYILSISLFCPYAYADDTLYTSWTFNSLTSIGGIPVSAEGNPGLFSINCDTACYFDGTEDRIVIDANPLIGLEEFTFEVVFRVDKGGVNEQKFIHLQAGNDIRILFELEFKNDSLWYMDNFIKSGGVGLSFIDSTRLFLVGRWYHAALVYKDNKFMQYINYQLQDTGSHTWISPVDGAVSIGARMNKVNYMTGAVSQIRFANTALDSNNFLLYGKLLEQHETFIMKDLEKINGYNVETFGDPEVVQTNIGPAIEFDGTEDGIYIHTNPLDSAKYFTIETIIKLYDVFPENAEPRYFHIEDADNGSRRMTMELRLTDNHKWYFDGFLRAGDQSVGLMDSSYTHPIDTCWEHIAITYNNGIFKTYVNYTPELESNWGPHFLPLGNKTKMSVGMRMNHVAHFNGLIQRVRVTKAVLDISEFMPIRMDSTSGSCINPDIDTTNTDTTATDTLNTLVYHNPSGTPFELQVFPNPATGISTLRVFNPSAGTLDLDLYDITGRKIDELAHLNVSMGMIVVSFDTSKYPKGSYILKVRNNNRIETKGILIR